MLSQGDVKLGPAMTSPGLVVIFTGATAWVELTIPGHPGEVEGSSSTRRSEQAFPDIRVSQPFQDILVGLRNRNKKD